MSYSLSDREGRKDGVPEREPPKKQAKKPGIKVVETRTVYMLREDVTVMIISNIDAMATHLFLTTNLCLTPF